VRHHSSSCTAHTSPVYRMMHVSAMQLERVERLGEEVWSRSGIAGVDRGGDSTSLGCGLADCSSVSQ
jgi:hypothetical protein